MDLQDVFTKACFKKDLRYAKWFYSMLDEPVTCIDFNPIQLNLQ
jgi:hypothetical protein